MRAALFVLIAMVLPLAAGAQSPPTGAGSARDYTVEAFGSVGYGGLYLGDSPWGSGLAWGGGLGVRPFRGWFDRLGFEVQVVSLQDREADGVVSRRLDSRLVTASAVYHFRGHDRVQPFVFGGLGHISADDTYACAECVFDRDPITGQLVSRGRHEWRSTGSKIGMSGGAGLKMSLHRHVAVRTELVLADTTPGSGYNWGWLQWQAGVAVRF